MLKTLKTEREWYKKRYKHGDLAFIGMLILKILLLPVAVLYRLFEWAYRYDD